MGVGLFAWPWPVAFGLAIAVTGLMGVLLERGAYRPLRRAPRISLLISAIAVSFLAGKPGPGHGRGPGQALPGARGLLRGRLPRAASSSPASVS